MRRLRLVGLSPDSQQVVFVDDSGTEFGAPADDRLRAALRGDRARLGQLEIEMESALRPRDIQARVRAGEAPEAVAALAGVPVERIMGYCVPVIAERQHVAALAGRSHVRRAGADGPARRLADVVAERLRGRGVNADGVEWDAWRRDDGRWSVHAAYQSGDSDRSATFVFDAVGRYSIADDDEAKWLTGERQQTSKGPQPRERAAAGDRRLTAVPSDDLLSLTSVDDAPLYDDDEGELSDDLTAVIRAVREVEPSPESHDGDFVDEADGFEVDQVDEVDGDALDSDDEEADFETDDEMADDGLVAHASADADAGALAAAVGHDAPPAAQEGKRRRNRRASMPSWDEIMLGRRGES